MLQKIFAFLFPVKGNRTTTGMVKKIDYLRNGGALVVLEDINTKATLCVEYPPEECTPHPDDTVEITYSSYKYPTGKEHHVTHTWCRLHSNVPAVHNTVPTKNKLWLVTR